MCECGGVVGSYTHTQTRTHIHTQTRVHTHIHTHTHKYTDTYAHVARVMGFADFLASLVTLPHLSLINEGVAFNCLHCSSSSFFCPSLFCCKVQMVFCFGAPCFPSCFGAAALCLFLLMHSCTYTDFSRPVPLQRCCLTFNSTAEQRGRWISFRVQYPRYQSSRYAFDLIDTKSLQDTGSQTRAPALRQLVHTATSNSTHCSSHRAGCT